MVRFKLLDGETVTTSRHTYEQALTAKAEGVGIEVGGPTEWDAIDFDDGYDTIRPARTIYPAMIGSIEQVPA